MSQGDFNVANGSGASVRNDINVQLAAAATNSSGDNQPATIYECQWWADKSSDELKLRNKLNDAWITMRGLDGSFKANDGSITAPTYNFSSAPNTGMTRELSSITDGGTRNTLVFSTDGARQLTIGGPVPTGAGGASLLWNVAGNPVTNGQAANDLNGVQFTSSGRVNIGNFGECLALNRSGKTGTGNLVGLHYNAAVVATISITASSVNYGTGSDYRLKENIAPLTGGKLRLSELNVKRFTFKADPTTYVDGFLAHEVQDVVPEAIYGEKDAVDDDGKPVMQNIDQSKIVPLLTAALQDAFAEIEALTDRVAALEAN